MFILINKTNLILGCSGQDGSFLSKSLLEKGEKVIGITRSAQGKIKNHIKLGIEKDIEIKEGNIKNFQTLEEIISQYKPNRIFNMAAQSSVGKSIQEPIDTIEGIVNGTLNLLEASRKLNYSGRIFFAGSSYIFGNIKDKADIYYPQNPSSPYAIAKQASFNLVKMYREVYSLNCMTGILFPHESNLRDDSFVTQKIITTVKQIVKNKDIKLRVGNIDIIRDWGWAPEYINAMQLIANSNRLKDHVICTGNAISLRTFIKKVFSRFELDWQEFTIVDQQLFRPSDIKRSCGNPKPLLKELKWKAEINIDKIIEKMISN